jgi:hypothetical protein
MDVSTGALKWEHVDPRLMHARFMSGSELVYYSTGRFVILNTESGSVGREFFNFHRCEVVAIDCSLCMDGKPLIVSVGGNGSVIVWNHVTGAVVAKGWLGEFSFSLGNAYCVQARLDSPRAHVAVSDDYGVHYVALTRLDSEEV